MILVTGGTGLLGSYLIRELAAQGKPVKALFRKNIPEEITSKAQWINGDILDVVFMDEVMEGVEQVYHCAGLVTFNPRKKSLLYKINVEGTANVVNASLRAGVKKLVHISSVSALGRKRDGMNVTEEAKWEEEKNLSNYGKSKYFGELEVWRGASEGLDAVVVNPTIVLGTGNWNESSSAIFKNAYDEFPWYTEGVSGFVDVKDVARAMVLLMDSDIKGEKFILNSENRLYKEVFSEIANCFGKRPPHRKVSKLMSGLAWRFEKLKSIFTGIDPLFTKETAETARMRVYFDNSKIKKFLPGFNFVPVNQSIEYYCAEYLKRNQS